MFYQYNYVLFMNLESVLFVPDCFLVLTFFIATVLCKLFTPNTYYLIIGFIRPMLVN